MSKYLTGLYKGEEIMIELEKDYRWCDHSNDVFIDRDFDVDRCYLDTYHVSERLRGNIFVRWAQGLKFDRARVLAERLVVGKDYLPPVDKKSIPTIADINAGDLLPGDFHLHYANDSELQNLYEPDVINRFEITEEQAVGLHYLIGLNLNKQAVVISMTEDEDLLIVYKYDSQYYTGVLKRKR
jgi:hypothetical protein